jgi:geranylgeranyl diphosphate synthase, type I
MSLPVQLGAEESSRGTADMAADRAAVDDMLLEFLAGKRARHTDPPVIMFIDLLREHLSGGKRLRPLLCCCGWRTVRGAEAIPSAVLCVAASLELFHAFALIQDDVMDNSDTRRGGPAAHRVLAARHADHPRPAWFGANTAILLGDLTLGWSYELAQAAGLDADQAVRLWPALDTMRAQTLCGQYLDLLFTGRPHNTVDEALAIARRKTAAYTVQYPLTLGALLAGADQDLLAACSAFGIAVGEAFQLRDDLLGVFGDPAQTGKPVLDDLREAKPTVLLAIARERANACERARLNALVGDPSLDQDGAAEARWILTVTGARAAVERMIAERCRHAMAVLADVPMHPAGAIMLHQLVSHLSRPYI